MSRPGSRTSRGARAIALTIGALYVVAGAWAFLAPMAFASTAAPFAPYNLHLFHDLGAFQVGLGLALVLGASARAGLLPALLAVLAASLLHLASHVEDRALGGHAVDVPALGLACVALAAAVLLERRAQGRPGAAMTAGGTGR